MVLDTTTLEIARLVDLHTMERDARTGITPAIAQSQIRLLHQHYNLVLDPVHMSTLLQARTHSSRSSLIPQEWPLLLAICPQHADSLTASAQEVEHLPPLDLDRSRLHSHSTIVPHDRRPRHHDQSRPQGRIERGACPSPRTDRARRETRQPVLLLVSYIWSESR